MESYTWKPGHAVFVMRQNKNHIMSWIKDRNNVENRSFKQVSKETVPMLINVKSRVCPFQNHRLHCYKQILDYLSFELKWSIILIPWILLHRNEKTKNMPYNCSKPNLLFAVNQVLRKPNSWNVGLEKVKFTSTTYAPSIYFSSVFYGTVILLLNISWYDWHVHLWYIDQLLLP